MGRVHRKGIAHDVKHLKHRDKRPCRSAPSAPTNVVLNFRKHEDKGKRWWNAIAKWDAVTTDVANRPVAPEQYAVQLRATDASGEAVETQGQAESTVAYGNDFGVQAGTTPLGTGLNKNTRELNASPDRIGKNLTGLTTGIEVAVDFNLRKDAGGSSPTVRCSVFDTTSSSEIVGKNASPETTAHPKTIATMSFTPAAGHAYEARVAWQSGTGIALFDQAQWRSKGDAAVWRKRVDGDETPLRAAFQDLPKARAWYFQTRVRCMNRTGGVRCWSAWSDWTTATNPVTGAEVGPPAPDGLVLTFHRNETRKKAPFQARCVWNETPWWMPPDGDAVEGADRYAIQLAVSNDGGSSTINTRRHAVQARDEDADQTSLFEFNNIARNRHYRFRVRTLKDDRRGAWSVWSAWKSPKTDIGNGPGDPLNVVTEKVKPGHFLVTWDPPADSDDVDYYRVRVFRLGNPIKTHKTRSHHFRYVVPDAHRGTAHRFRVMAVDNEENQSAETDQSDQTDDPDTAGEGFEVGDVRKLAHVSIANWLANHPKWLRANGQGLSTTTYSLLFAEIGYTYGGSGATFNLPDLNGRHSIGVSSVLAVGANDGDIETARLAVHAHASDSTSTTPGTDSTSQTTPSDTTFADVGTGNQVGTAGSDFTNEQQAHTHAAGSLQNSTNPATVPRGTAASDAAGPSHGHTIFGFTDDRSASHDHQGHGHNSGHGHNHGHNNGNHHHGHGHGGHGHGHNHGGHGHGHGHDQKKRPHLAVHYVIKVLP